MLLCKLELRAWVCVECEVIQGKLRVVGHKHIPVGLVSSDFRL